MTLGLILAIYISLQPLVSGGDQFIVTWANALRAILQSYGWPV